MHGIFDGKVKRLERQKEATLIGLESYSTEQLSFRPGPGCWSLLEVVDHLQRTEQGILAAVLRTIPTARVQSLKDRVQAQMLIGLFLLPSRVKVPGAVTSILPGQNLSLPDVRERWRVTRAQLATALPEFPTMERTAVFQHPVSGWMTMAQTLGFLSAHLTHHAYQIRRIRRALAAPESVASGRPVN